MKSWMIFDETNHPFRYQLVIMLVLVLLFMTRGTVLAEERCGCDYKSMPETRIVLLGATGVGKSTFGNRSWICSQKIFCSKSIYFSGFSTLLRKTAGKQFVPNMGGGIQTIPPENNTMYHTPLGSAIQMSQWRPRHPTWWGTTWETLQILALLSLTLLEPVTLNAETMNTASNSKKESRNLAQSLPLSCSSMANVQGSLQG